jgi:predicted methyltransferase
LQELFTDVYGDAQLPRNLAEQQAELSGLSADVRQRVGQHRADGNRGYLREADVIAAFEARGFVFEGSSEVNANPNDPADADGGVWTRLPSSSSEEARAIGETDRMTLRFRKPD